MMISIANNANFCIKHLAFFTIMENSFGFLSCPKYLNGNMITLLIGKKRSKWKFIISHSLKIQISDDLSSLFHICRNFFNKIETYTYTDKLRLFYQYLFNYIFERKRYIVDYSEVVLAKMQGIKVGVQLRFGGETAVSQETE